MKMALDATNQIEPTIDVDIDLYAEKLWSTIINILSTIVLEQLKKKDFYSQPFEQSLLQILPLILKSTEKVKNPSIDYLA